MLTNKQKKKINKEGELAYILSLFPDNNPYQEGTEEYQIWEDSYYSKMEENSGW